MSESVSYINVVEKIEHIACLVLFITVFKQKGQVVFMKFLFIDFSLSMSHYFSFHFTNETETTVKVTWWDKILPSSLDFSTIPCPVTTPYHHDINTTYGKWMAKNIKFLKVFMCSTSKSLFLISTDTTALPFTRWFLGARRGSYRLGIP